MDLLNLPSFQIKTQQQGNKTKIFDEIRQKFVALTPEEWVRQHMVRYLLDHKGYPRTLITVETKVMINGLTQRADVIIYNRKGIPVMIIECKATTVPLSNLVFEQIARYNMNLKVNYLVLTNGLQHYCARLNFDKMNYHFLKEIPPFEEIGLK